MYQFKETFIEQFKDSDLSIYYPWIETNSQHLEPFVDRVDCLLLGVNGGSRLLPPPSPWAPMNSNFIRSPAY